MFWKITIFIAVIGILLSRIGNENHFVFKPSDMKTIANKAIREAEGDYELLIQLVVENLQEKYPDNIIGITFNNLYNFRTITICVVNN